MNKTKAEKHRRKKSKIANSNQLHLNSKHGYDFIHSSGVVEFHPYLWSFSMTMRYSGLAVLATAKMMYAHSLLERWPRGHPLSKLPTSLDGASQLVQLIVKENVQSASLNARKPPSVSQYCGSRGNQSNFGASGGNSNQEKCQKVNVIPLLPLVDEHIEDLKKILHRILINHKRCYYQKFVKFFLTRFESGPKLKEKSLQPVHHTYIIRLTIFICIRILPKELLGGTQNWTHWKKILSSLIRTSQFEEIRLGTAVQPLKLKQIPWLKKILTFFMKSQLLAQVVSWLLKDFVMVFISNHFYVTEFMGERRKLAYYWKPVWQRIQDKGLKSMIEAGKLEQLSEMEADFVVSNFESTCTISRLRLIPKHKGVRPVVKVNYNDDPMVFKVNYLLQQFVRLSVKSSVTSEKLHSMYRSILQRTSKESKLYFVRCDISDAYGSIEHHQLKEILQELAKKYIRGIRLTLLELPIPADKNNRRLKKIYYYKNITLASGYEKHIFKKEDNKATYLNGYVVERNISGEALLSSVNEVISNLIVELGLKLRLWLKKGVPQGFRWSSALSDLYYEALTNKHLSSFQEGGTLMRTVDDFLYITTNKDQAIRFKNRMQEGFPDYGCSINIKKTQSNLDEQTHLVKFCGVTFNTDTHELSGDYAIFENQNMKYSVKMTLPSMPHKYLKGESFLGKRLKVFGALRISSELFDFTYNSKKCVIENFFSACLLLAFRANAIVQHVYTRQSLNEKFVMKNVGWACTRVSKYVYRLIAESSSDSDISLDALLWIAYKAFNWKFGRNSTQYSQCIRGTKVLMQKKERLLANAEVTYLKKRTETISSVFYTMK